MANYTLPDGSTPSAGRNLGELPDAHRNQYNDVLAALRGEENIRVGLAENRQSISVIVGAYESARTGKPISLIWDGQASSKGRLS